MNRLGFTFCQLQMMQGDTNFLVFDNCRFGRHLLARLIKDLMGKEKRGCGERDKNRDGKERNEGKGECLDKGQSGMIFQPRIDWRGYKYSKERVYAVDEHNFHEAK